MLIDIDDSNFFIETSNILFIEIYTLNKEHTKIFFNVIDSVGINKGNFVFQIVEKPIQEVVKKINQANLYQMTETSKSAINRFQAILEEK